MAIWGFSLLAEAGRPASRATVTDRNGEAHFDVGSGSGKVIVNGTTSYRGRLAGRVVAYL